MFKKIFLSLTALTMIFSCSITSAQTDAQDPYEMLTTVAQDTFDTLKANKDRVKSDPLFRRELVREKLLPYMDTAYSAYMVIGSNMQQTTEEQRKAFTAAFAEYVIASYAEALGKYDNQELVLPPPQQVKPEDTMINYKFLIREEGKQDLELVFKLRKNKNTGEWKAFDMVAENISMLQAKQSELTPLIRKNGIDSVTAMLIEKTASGNLEPVVEQ